MPPVPTPPPPGATSEAPRAQRAPRPPRRDPAPKQDAQPVSPVSEMSEKQVTEAIGEILSLPALVFKAPNTPFHCDICAAHFAKQGPETAKELVANKDAYPALYGAMTKVAIAWNSVSLLPTVIGYVGKPVVHHGPDALQPAAPMFGLEPREPKVKPVPHEHSAATEGTQRPPVPVTPEANGNGQTPRPVPRAFGG